MRKTKINKVKVGIGIAIIVILITHLTGFGKYVYNNIKDRYLSSENFYFTSNLLEVNKATYEYNNWGGMDEYKLDLELYSFQNELLRSENDLEYNITCSTTSTKIDIAIGSLDGDNTDEGIIYAETNEEVVSIYLIPKEGASFELGDKITITVTAYTTEPYSKTISADFVFEITAQGADYQIEDIANRSYALVKLKNTLAIDSSVTLRFDPEVVRLDMNDEVYLRNIGYKTEKIDNVDYVNEITFLMTKESSKNIKFYKIDKSQDYSAQLDIFELIKTEIEEE